MNALPDSIAAITVSATPTQVTTYSLGADDVPDSLAVQSGKLWVSYSDGAGIHPGAIGDIDLSTGTFGAQATTSTWPSPPDLAADPSDTGVLVAVLPGAAPATAETFTTTTDSDSATRLSAQGVLGATGGMCSNEHQLAVFPGGTELTSGDPVRPDPDHAADGIPR